MKITLTKKIFMIWNTAVILLGTVAVWTFLKFVMPEHYFEWFPFIPLFFYIFSWYSILMFDRCRRKTPNKLLLVYMGVKFVKFILSAIIVLFYVLHVEEHKEDFILVFFLFYLFSMVFQSWFFMLYEAHKMKQKKERKCVE